MAQSAGSSSSVGQNSRWKWSLAVGVLLLLLGIAGVGIAAFMELTSVLVFGPLLLVIAAVQLVISFLAESRKESVFHFMASGVEAVLGFWIMIHPLERLIDLVVVLAVFFLVSAAIRTCQALAKKSAHRIWNLLAAAVALILGVCVLARWPDSRWWFLGLCIALDFLFRGISWSALGLANKKQQPAA